MNEVSINLNKVISQLLPQAIEQGLDACGYIVENQAKENLHGHVDTGILRASITHEVEKNVCTIFTDTEYSVYVHEGTGIYAIDGRKEPWRYQDAKGKWHTTRGQRGVPFMRDAVDEKMNELPQVFEKLLEKQVIR